MAELSRIQKSLNLIFSSIVHGRFIIVEHLQIGLESTSCTTHREDTQKYLDQLEKWIFIYIRIDLIFNNPDLISYHIHYSEIHSLPSLNNHHTPFHSYSAPWSPIMIDRLPGELISQEIVKHITRVRIQSNT
jgi:hypothetical protein